MTNESMAIGNRPQSEDAVVGFRPHWISVAIWLGRLFLAAVFLAHFGLIGLGQWLSDEYGAFGGLMIEGWTFFGRRFAWSPRPLSEALYCGYGWAVIRWHRPMIGSFLGILWAGLMVAGVWTFWQNRRTDPGEDHWPDLLVALALLALFVASVGHTLWVFYWPAAAVAYLPTIAATMLLFLQVARGRISRMDGRMLCSCCLMIAACSSEAGAIFVFCYGLFQGAEWVVAGFHKRPNVYRRFCAWWLVPTVASAAILGTVRFNRFRMSELRAVSATSGLSPGPLKGHVLASIAAGLQEILAEVVGRSAHLYKWHGFGSRVPCLILMAVGVGLSWSRFGRLSRVVALQTGTVVVALLLASTLTISGAYLHFGVLCCPQHEALRLCWILMSFAGAGMLLSEWMAKGYSLRPEVRKAWAHILLCSAVLSAWHIKPIAQAYRAYEAICHTTAENFSQGFDSAHQTMTYSLLPETLIAQLEIAPGRYSQYHQPPGDVQSLLAFFRKTSVDVRPSTAHYGDPGATDVLAVSGFDIHRLLVRKLMNSRILPLGEPSELLQTDRSSRLNSTHSRPLPPRSADPNDESETPAPSLDD